MKRSSALVAQEAEAAFQVYVQQPWERSLRRLGAQIGRNPSTMRTWSRRFHWQERAAKIDLEQHRGVFNRREWRRFERKCQMWRSDPRMHTRAGRHKLAVHAYQSYRRSGAKKFPNDEETRVWLAGQSRYVRWAIEHGVWGKPHRTGRRPVFENVFLGAY
jgi:hypothetical protein